MLCYIMLFISPPSILSLPVCVLSHIALWFPGAVHVSGCHHYFSGQVIHACRYAVSKSNERLHRLSLNMRHMAVLAIKI